MFNSCEQLFLKFDGFMQRFKCRNHRPS